MSDPFSDFAAAINTVTGNGSLGTPSGGPIADALQNATGINPHSDIIDLSLQYVTHGLVGFKNGKPTKGFLTNAIDESIGEVTGRNAARKQIMQQEDAVNAEAARKDQQLKDEQLRAYRQDVNASNFAYYSQASANSKNGSGMKSNNIGSSDISQDFLGL